MDADPFKSGGFPVDYPADIRTYYSPVDDVHGAILDLIQKAKKSLYIGMYGWDDPDFQKAILEKMKDEGVYVQLTLDSSQAAGAHEKVLLNQAQFPATSIAEGRSEKGAIMHLKVMVIDGESLVTGSTNWSASGETKQDNACVIINNIYVASECITRLSAIHANMLKRK